MALREITGEVHFDKNQNSQSAPLRKSVRIIYAFDKYWSIQEQGLNENGAEDVPPD